MLAGLSTITCLISIIAFSTLVRPQFVTTNGLQFELDGKPFTFAGANLWPIGFTTNEYANNAIQSAKSKGLPVLRVAAWNEKDLAHGKNPGDSYFQEWTNGKPTINEGANGLQVLDYAVKQAENAGIKLIMCLTNNWLDYGGMDTYTMNLLGEQQFTHTNFYTNQQVIDTFKTYIDNIINRYKASPAIFSWELANEARCQESNCQGSSVLTNWADEISQHIKSLDGNHLVTFGGYGYLNEGKGSHNYDFNYDGDSGEDYKAILALKSIDFGTVHHYTDNDTIKGEDYGLQWLKDHNSISVAANKPMVVEELGVNRQSSDISMTDILSAFEKYMADAKEANAIQGTLLWSCDVMGADCPGQNDPYAICQGEEFYGTLVTDFTKIMANKSGDGGAVIAPPTSTSSISTSSAIASPTSAVLPLQTSGAEDGEETTCEL